MWMRCDIKPFRLGLRFVRRGTAAAMPASFAEIENALRAIKTVAATPSAVQPLLSNLETMVEKSSLTAGDAMEINTAIMLTDHMGLRSCLRRGSLQRHTNSSTLWDAAFIATLFLFADCVCMIISPLIIETGWWRVRVRSFSFRAVSRNERSSCIQMHIHVDR